MIFPLRAFKKKKKGERWRWNGNGAEGVEKLIFKQARLVLIRVLQNSSTDIFTQGCRPGCWGGKPPTDLDKWLAPAGVLAGKNICSVSTLRGVLAQGKVGRVICNLLACFPLLERFCIKQKEFLPPTLVFFSLMCYLLPPNTLFLS